MEVLVKADLKTCEERDPKGMYKKAIKGEIKEFTGISAPYEEPLNPEIILDTDSQTIEEETRMVIEYLRKNGII